jgi:hypothetical protein
LKRAAVPTPLLEPDVVPDELPPASVMTVLMVWGQQSVGLVAPKQK